MTRLSRRAFCAGLAVAGAIAPATAQTRAIHDARGVVKISGAPRRIIALDGRHTENVLALGLQPIGVAGLDIYRRFMDGATPALDKAVADVGLTATPNIEIILSLAPDLILASARNLQRNGALLESIAPVLAYDPYPVGGADLYETMLATFHSVAEALNRQAEAEAFLTRLDGVYAELKARLASAGWAGRRVVLGNVNAGITGADVMIFNDNAIPAEVLRRLGLDYVYADRRYREKGFNVTTVEALPALQEATFLYLPFNVEGVRTLMSTPIWRNLDFVRNSRIHEIPYRQMYGGPLTAEAFARDVAAALLR